MAETIDKDKTEQFICLQIVISKEKPSDNTIVRSQGHFIFHNKSKCK